MELTRTRLALKTRCARRWRCRQTSSTTCCTRSTARWLSRCTAVEQRANNLHGITIFLPESHGQNLALTVLSVPNSLDVGAGVPDRRVQLHQQAKFRPWLEPFSVQKSSKLLKFSLVCSAADNLETSSTTCCTRSTALWLSRSTFFLSIALEPRVEWFKSL